MKLSIHLHCFTNSPLTCILLSSSSSSSIVQIIRPAGQFSSKREIKRERLWVEWQLEARRDDQFFEFALEDLGATSWLCLFHEIGDLADLLDEAHLIDELCSVKRDGMGIGFNEEKEAQVGWIDVGF